MPRYFFHRSDGGFVPDTEGTVLPDLDAARTAAAVFAAEMIRDRPHFVWDGRDFRVEVTDEGGTLLCTVIVLGVDAVVARAR